MKKIILIFVLVAISLTTIFANSGGDGNIDGDGGDMGGGTGSNVWSSGNEGVRVTVVDALDGSIKSTPIDYTNIIPVQGIAHFGKVSKTAYVKNNQKLAPNSNEYTYKKPITQLPKIITSSSGNGNIQEIRKYFVSEGFLMQHSELTGISYDELISGKYKLLIEPLAYFKFNGRMYAMTATEGALYNSMSGNNLLKNKMGALTHQNLPLSIFLQRADLGYPIWGGTSASRVTDSQILSSLGIGIISFKDDEEPGDPSNIYHYEYRTNTEVISSIYVRSTDEITPDDNAYVSFDVNGKTYKKHFVCPPNSSQLVWVRWTTPSTPQDVNILVSTEYGTLETNAINCKISEITENTPPDPTPHDRNDRFIFNIPPLSNVGNKSNSWSEWWAYWEENWQWKSRKCQSSCPVDCSGGHGRWVDNGKWIYEKDHYNASLVVKSQLVPADSVITHYKKGDTWEMKSGYGVEIDIKSYRDYNSTNYDVTETQNAMSFFPEFKYKTYNRILEKVDSSFVFKHNKYSFVGENCHYTPLWYPDNTKYEVENIAFDMWTPAGQLWGYASDFIFIEGNVYDDYDIVEVSPTDPDFHRYGE